METFLDIADIVAQASLAKTNLAPDEMQKSLHDAILESVKFHLIADVPVGIFLSAGLDSTVIAALASEAKGQELKTFTIGFDECRGTLFDETVLAEEVAKTYGAQHHTEWISRKDFEGEIPNILSSMDQPSIDGINNYFVSKVASERGLKVALSGLGGDEIFGTYKTFKFIPIITRFTKFNEFMPRFGRLFRRFMSKALNGSISTKWAGMFEYGYTYDKAYFLGRSCFMPWELPGLLGVDEACDGLEGLQPHFQHLEKMIANVHNGYLKIMLLEITQYMRSQLLRHADWAGMSHSLEVRVPLVDTELLKSLAPLFSQPIRPTKMAMAKSVSNPLPEALFSRRKTGFYTPLNRWLNESGKLVSKRAGFRQWALYVHKYFINGGKGRF
jgi:asparagine synthase (glutamine-hydrolysing)